MLKIEDLNFDVLFPQTVFNNKSVKVVHFNNSNNRQQMYLNMYPINRGIPCAVGIINPEGTVIDIGVSYCNPQDNYNRKLARNIAYARAKFAIHSVYTITQILDNFIKHYNIRPTYENGLLMDVIRNRKNELTFYDLSLTTILNYAYKDCNSFIANEWYNQSYLDEEIFTMYNNLIKDYTIYDIFVKQPKSILQRCKDKYKDMVKFVFGTERSNSWH